MRVAILRFSAIGDVALCVPVIRAFQLAHPEVEITMVSRKMLKPLFAPLNIRFLEADFKGRHKGNKGLLRLYRDIKKTAKPDVVIDLHSVLRTHILKSFFRLANTPVFTINKGRKGKKQLTRYPDKILSQQSHTTDRYAKVFREAGFPFHWDKSQPPVLDYKSEAAEKELQKLQSYPSLIGVAPLAGFPGKTWPLNKMRQLIESISDPGHAIVLFGGPEDLTYLEKLRGDNSHVYIMAGKLKFDGEIAFMRRLSLMIAMDSSNMHLATLAGIPVVSIWGATHSLAGFGPLGNNAQYKAEIPIAELNCRPCSVFGKKPCFRKDYACLNQLGAETVLNKVNAALNQTGQG